MGKQNSWYSSRFKRSSFTRQQEEGTTHNGFLSTKYTIIFSRAHFEYYLFIKLYCFTSVDHQDASDSGLDICCLLDAMANVANNISYRAQRK